MAYREGRAERIASTVILVAVIRMVRHWHSSLSSGRGQGGDQTAVEWVQFILKAVVGTCLFTMILWCAQSNRPRAAGMMLTFPVLNGLGLLMAESHDLHLMAQAMFPMIALNGLLCATYIVTQRQLLLCFPHLSPRVPGWTL